MDLVCIGLNHKTCPVEIREKLAFSEPRLLLALAQLKDHADIRESFVLSTCNRVEIYGRGFHQLESAIIQFLSTFHDLPSQLFEGHLYQLKNAEVVQHLFRVASGLDSLVVGENEIFGQVRHAFRLGNQEKTLSSVLYQVVERSIRVGKRVRSETTINDRAISVSSIAVELAEKIFGSLSGERVLVLGTGKMSEQTLKHLVSSGAEKVSVASRRYERALEIARKYGAKPIGFEMWFRALEESDIVISSTASPAPLIQFQDVKHIIRERKHKPLCFIDIAVPRDIDPRVGEIDDVYLYDIDDLKGVSESNLRLRKKEIEKCEAIIDREVDSFQQWYDHLEAKPVIRKLTSYFDQVVEQELDRARKKFKGKEKELDLLARRIKASLLHIPLEQLKEAARFGSTDRHLETLDSLFQLEKKLENKKNEQ